MGPYIPPPHAAARSRSHGSLYGLPLLCLSCHVPLSGLLTLLLVSRVCHGSLYGLPLLLSPSPHSAMCHFQVSS
ncbi:unnamed protein product, partial [Staurois parvus]